LSHEVTTGLEKVNLKIAQLNVVLFENWAYSWKYIHSKCAVFAFLHFSKLNFQLGVSQLMMRLFLERQES
jgi:hypothetical protein